MPGKHALLSASASARWLACPPSALLEATFPESTSPYAEEGTRAHALCELRLRSMLEGKDFHDGLASLDFEPDDEMLEATEFYEGIVTEEFNAAKATCKYARLLVEQRIDFSKYVPDGFGTADSVIVGDKKLTVVDFKYGRGVQVNAAGNSQLRLYALGALHALGPLYEFETIQTIIVQPRLGHVDSEELEVVELLDWGVNTVAYTAKLAAKGKGSYNPGPHCKFCRAAGTCRARVEAAFEVLDKNGTKPALLTDEEIPEILDKLDNAEEWIKAIRAYAQERAVAGQHWAGYKLVEGRTQRRIEDQLKVLSVLEGLGYSPEEVTTSKLKGISELERLIGKKAFAENLSTYVVKPHGEPVLVKESDKRETYNPIEEAFKEK